MNKNGDVVIIEDNEGAQQLLREMFERLTYKNNLKFFDNAEEALIYIKNCNPIPFLILSDVNLPKVDGFTLKKTIDDDYSLRLKSIPFIFFSTAATKKDVEKAFLIRSQGFFLKPTSLEKLEKTLNIIMQYWNLSLAPHDL